MKKGNTTPLILQARQAQVKGDFSQLGCIIKKANSVQERGCLLGMLACEVALRKKNLKLARHVLQMSRLCFIDDYANLIVARRQAELLPHFVNDPTFVEEFLTKREQALKDLIKRDQSQKDGKI